MKQGAAESRRGGELQEATGVGVHDNQREERTEKLRRGWEGSDGWSNGRHKRFVRRATLQLR